MRNLLCNLDIELSKPPTGGTARKLAMWAARLPKCGGGVTLPPFPPFPPEGERVELDRPALPDPRALPREPESDTEESTFHEKPPSTIPDLPKYRNFIPNLIKIRPKGFPNNYRILDIQIVRFLWKQQAKAFVVLVE